MRVLRSWGGFLLGFGMIWGCEVGYSPTEGTTQAGAANDPTVLAVPTSANTQEKVNIAFSSDPVGVEIWIDGVFSGVSPKAFLLEKSDKELSLEFKMDGYVSASQKLTPNRDTPVIAKLRPAQAQAAPAPKKVQAAPAPKQGEPAAAPKTEEEKKIEKKDKIKTLIDR